MTRALPLLLLAAAGCATTPRAPHAAPPGVERFSSGLDWQAAGDETARLLSEYLKVDTVSPPGNETRGAQWLAAVLAREGVDAEVLEFAPGRGSLVARLTAQGEATEQPLCLVSHIDVVPAEAERWPKEQQPLSGARSDGFVWGRGALDMKGMGAMELEVLLLLKRRGVPLKRDVVLVAVADEETGSGGMRHLVEQHWDKLGCAHAVNEGGFGVKDLMAPGQTAFAVAVGEKGTLWLDVTARGEPGHGSTPLPGRAPGRLLEALDALLSFRAEPRVPEALYETLRLSGADAGGLSGFVLQRPALVRALAIGKLLGKPRTRAAVTDTCQLTGLEGRGSAANVVPGEVHGILDCRLLPGSKPEALLETLRARVAHLKGVELRVLGQKEGNESPWDDPFFDALARHAVRGRPGVIAGPIISLGYTDSLLLRPKGTRAYGLIPFELTQADLDLLHGTGERVSVENLRRGVEVLYRAVVDVSARP